jgi:hypothetical protein
MAHMFQHTIETHVSLIVFTGKITNITYTLTGDVELFTLQLRKHG